MPLTPRHRPLDANRRGAVVRSGYEMQTLVVIPARLGSTRLPRKPLADLGGQPLILHVLRQASLAKGVDQVCVATDSKEIASVVEGAGGCAIMTRSDHASGTDRVWEAAGHFPGAEAVVNVQGDEPFLNPLWIELLCARLSEPTVELVTASAPWLGDPSDPSGVKVWVDESGRAVDFARDPARLPGTYRRHQGLYGFRRDALGLFVSLPPSPREIAERLEQLRWIEAQRPIHMVEVEEASISVDTPADLERAREAVIGRPALCYGADESVS